MPDIQEAKFISVYALANIVFFEDAGKHAFTYNVLKSIKRLST